MAISIRFLLLIDNKTNTYEPFFSDFLTFSLENSYLFCRKWYICRAKTELTCARLLDGCGFLLPIGKEATCQSPTLNCLWSGKISFAYLSFKQ